MMNPRVYITSGDDDNSDWIDATDIDDMRECIEKLVGKEEWENEDWEVDDWEDFGGIMPTDIERVAELGALIEEHGEAFATYADYVGEEFATGQGFEDSYCGEWDSEEAYAENYFDDTHEIPESIASYIDYGAFTRDLFMSDNFSVDNGSGVYVFYNR